MAGYQPYSFGRSWCGKGNMNAGGETDHADVHLGTTRRRDSTGGTDPGGQDQSRSASGTSGSSSQGQQQPTDWNGEDHDDPIKIDVHFPKAFGVPEETFTVFDLGQSMWLHLKKDQDCMNQLKEKLRAEYLSFSEDAGPHKVVLNCSLSYFRQEKVKFVKNLFIDAVARFCMMNLPHSYDEKCHILKKWPGTQLYESRKATIHKTHSGNIVLVTSPEYRQEVLDECQKLLIDHQTDDLGRQESDQKTELSNGSTVTDTIWKPVESLIEDQETVNVMLHTTITIDGPLLQFLQTKNEARDHVVHCFERMNIECKFELEAEQLILTTDKKNQINTQTVLKQFVSMTSLPWEDKVHKFCKPDEFSSLCEENLPKQKGKFMVYFPRDKETLLIISTNDITELVKTCAETVINDVKDVFKETGAENFQKVLEMNSWTNNESKEVKMKDGRVIVRPICNKNKYGFFVRGFKANVSEYVKDLTSILSKGEETSSGSFTISDDEEHLLHDRPVVKEFVVQAGKEKGYLYKVEGKTVLVTSPRDVLAKAEEHFKSLFAKPVTLTREDPTLDLPNFEVLRDMLMQRRGIHQDKLLIDLDDADTRFTLIGTNDIFPSILKELEDMKLMYKKAEKTLPLIQRHMEYIFSKGNSDLCAITGDPRMNVKVTPCDVNSQPAIRVTGSRIGVDKVFKWVKSTCGEQKRETCSQTSEVDCTQRKTELAEPSDNVPLPGFLEHLLREIPHAMSFIMQEFTKEDFTIEFDSGYKNALIRVKDIEDLPAAKACLSKCAKMETINFEGHKFLSPQVTKTLLEEQQPDVTSKMIVYPDIPKNTLMLVGTIDVADPVLDDLQKLLDDYREECLVLSLTKEEARSSDLLGRLNTSEHRKKSVEMVISSEQLHITGPKVKVEECFTSLCCFIKTLTKSTRQNCPSKMRMCEQNTSESIIMALKENDNIWEYLVSCFDRRGYGVELHDMKLRLYAGSITALLKVRAYFPALLSERTYYLFGEPVVRMKGIEYVVEMLSKNPDHDEKFRIHKGDTCTLNIVCTSDILESMEDDLQEIRNSYVLQVLETKLGIISETNIRQIEKELSDSEPGFKDKFKLQPLEDGKIEILATSDFLLPVKLKVEHILQWKQREAQINKANPKHDVQLTDLELEFMQKVEVINYIDEKLKHFQFMLDKRAKVLRLYAIKETLLADGMKSFQKCFEKRRIDLLNDPVLENLTLKGFKKMLNKHGKHGKFAVHIDENRKCLELICTNDVLESVLKVVDQIRARYSNVNEFIACQYDKWVALKMLYPEELHQIKIQLEEMNFNQDNGNIELIGHKQNVVAAKKQLEGVMERLRVVSVPLLGNVSDVLQTEEGKVLINDVQNDFSCAVTIADSDKNVPQEMVDRKYLANLQLRLSPHTCVRLSQWTSANGSNVSIIQGKLQDLDADLLAIPVVKGHLPISVEKILKSENGQTTLQKIKNMNVTNNKVSVESPDWLKCQIVVFFWIPTTLKDGKNQEKTTLHKIIKDILSSKINNGMSMSCVFMLESLWQTPGNFLKAGTKCIIRGSQEAFSAQAHLSIEVCLLTDEKHNTHVMEILKQACPDSKRFSFSRQVKKLKDRFTSSVKENPSDVIHPHILVNVGQLQKQEVDVLVNSAHHMLDLSQGIVSKVLNTASKGALQKQCTEKFPNGIRYGEVAVTNSGGNLRCKHVFHGALSSYDKRNYHKEPGERACWENMQSFLFRCMHEASKRQLLSIAFPVLGTGTLKYPADRVVQVMFNTVEWYFSDNPSSTVKTVKFVVFDTDTSNIKLFKAELMARNYQVNGFLNEGTSPCEARLDSENGIMLQIIENDIRNCEGSSDGLLCFWNEKQLTAPSSHPLVGEHLNSIEWSTYASEMKKKGLIKTPGGMLPARIIVHVPVKEKKFMDALQQGLATAGINRCRSVQLALLPQDFPDDPKAFVSGLMKILKSYTITNEDSCIYLMTVVVQEQEFFKSVVYHLNEVSKTSGLWAFVTNMASAIWNMKSPTQIKPAVDTAKDSDDTVKLVVYARTDKDCRRATDRLQKEISKIAKKKDAQISVDGSSVDNEEFKTGAKDHNIGEIDKVFVKCRSELNPRIVASEKWKEAENCISTLGGRLNKSEITYVEGDFDAMIKIHDSLKNLGKQLSVTVKQLHLEAVNYICGQDEIDRYCHIEDMPDFHKKICFIVGPGDESKVMDLQQRVQGVIQEELDLQKEQQTISKEKAIGAAEAVMKDNRDVYIKYMEDNHTLIMFAEDWDKMSRAKKRVQLQFGQSKTTSRGKRRFAGSDKPEAVETVETVETVDSRNDDKISFIRQSGSAIAEGRHIVVKVHQTDITKLPVDAIVNAANGNLNHAGGVARVISAAGGTKIWEHSNMIVQKNGPVKVTHLAVTEPGKLPCNMVFHAVGPEWYKYTDKNQCLEDLCCTILRCLCEATNRKIASIAIPSISSSIFGVPQEACAQMYVRALKSFDAVVANGSLRDVHFVDISDKMVGIIMKELDEKWEKPLDKTTLARDMAFVKENLELYAGTIVVSGEAVKASSSRHEKELKPEMQQFGDNVSLLITLADILKQTADAVVSWEDFTFSTERPLVQDMLREGGENYRIGRDCANRKLRNMGDIEDFAGGSLPQKHVVFALLGNETKPDDFKDVLSKIFKRCCEKKYQTLILPVFSRFQQVPGKNRFTLFTESVVDELLNLKGNSSALQISIIANKQHVVDELTQKLHDYCVVKELRDKHSGPSMQETDASGEIECTICMSPPTNPTSLKCGDVFCKECIDTAFKIKKVCPNCKAVCGIIRGNMPHGTMTERVENKGLPGFGGYKTIVINYYFSDGIQTKDHPHPGQWYKGTTRIAYLPDTAEGRKVLGLLKVAWKRKLTFTVGESVTIHGGGVRVTWNEIHHKTNKDGGSANHGYPDPDYLRRVQEELAAQGVTEADLGATGTSV